MATNGMTSPTENLPATYVAAFSTEVYFATVDYQRLVRVRVPGFTDASYYWVSQDGTRRRVEDRAWAFAMYAHHVKGLPFRIPGR